MSFNADGTDALTVVAVVTEPRKETRPEDYADHFVAVAREERTCPIVAVAASTVEARVTADTCNRQEKAPAVANARYVVSINTVLRRLFAIHTITYSKNDFQMVKVQLLLHLALAFLLNYPNFSDSCFFCQLLTPIDFF